MIELSKMISYILRHAPWEYELELDNDGWVEVDQLLSVLRMEKQEWANLQLYDLEKIIEASAKPRHQIENGKIRALYGHSTPYKITKQLSEPPKNLYHGTSEEAAKAKKQQNRF